MIKFLLKSLIAVILLLLLIPLSRLLIWIASHLFAEISIIAGGAIDPLGFAALIIIGVALLLIAIAIKS